jgi:hypothetical protein
LPGDGESAARPSPHGRPPISDRLCDLVTVFAATWTVACHAAVATGGSLYSTYLNFGVLTALCAAAWIRLRRHAAGTSPLAAAPVRPNSAIADDAERRALPLAQLMGLLFGVLALLAYALNANILWLWWSCVAVLGFALVSECFAGLQPEPLEAPSWTPRQEAALWAMGAGCALILLTFHRADYDSAFYVSMAVAAADFPAAPLMLDTIHGIAGLGVHMPAHRVHSYEVFNGALSHLTGLPAIVCYHVVTAATAALLVPIAFARLFRILTPRHWLWSVFAVLVVLVGVGSTPWWYANLSVVRIFHGKSVYMSLFLPLAYAYGLRFGAQPTLRRWLLLFAVQIAAVGCSSSALWSVPIAAGLAVLSSVRWDRNVQKTLVFAGLASCYVVGVGTTLIGDLERVAAVVTNDPAPGVDLEFAFDRVLGDGAVRIAALAAALMAWAFRRSGPARRFAILIPLVVFVLVLNPYWSEQVSRYMTGPSYWRVMWSLPVPILIALILTAPLQLDRSSLQRKAAAVVAVLAMLVFVALVPDFSALSRSNRVRIGELGKIKAPFKWYTLASMLVHLAPPKSMVVAPQKAALWVHTFHGHPFVTSSRELYVQRIAAELGIEEADRRLFMSEAVSLPGKDIELRIRETEGYRRRHEVDDPVRRFREGLRRYDVRGVCINAKAPLYAPILKVLQAEAFTLKRWRFGFQIWIRSPESDRALRESAGEPIADVPEALSKTAG